MRNAIFLVVITLFIFIGCGDSSDSPTEPVTVITPGLSGNTYLNTKYGIKITNLPVDEWTVKALGGDMQGLRVQSEQGYIPLYSLLLMEPVPSNKYVGPNEQGYLNPVVEAGIPFIWVSVDYERGVKVETGDLSKALDNLALDYAYKIELKKPVYVGNSAGTQAVLSHIEYDEKGVLTWFAKGEFCVRCEYWTTKSGFDSYLEVYNNVIKNIWLMGT